MAELVWFYTPVQHDGYVAVHSASYDEVGKLVSIDPTEQDLRDIALSNLLDFVSMVMHGIVNKPLVSAADYAAKVSASLRP